jgi:hypothetical protein
MNLDQITTYQIPFDNLSLLLLMMMMLLMIMMIVVG